LLGLFYDLVHDGLKPICALQQRFRRNGQFINYLKRVAQLERHLQRIIDELGSDGRFLASRGDSMDGTKA
jgi:hypothetical protein